MHCMTTTVDSRNGLNQSGGTWMHRKLIMGALALALPVGVLAATGAPAFAKKPPPNPVLCTGLSATVTFGLPLTVAGVTTTSKLGNATTLGSGTFSCAGGVTGTSPALTIPGGKNTKNPKVKHQPHTYQTGTWAEFASAGGTLKKSLKIIDFTINGGLNVFKAKSSSLVVGGSCGPDVGFLINGMVKIGHYDTKVASVLACLGTDTRTDSSHGTFLGDYLVTNGVVSAQIDPAESQGTL